MLSWVLRDNRNIYLKKMTLRTVFKLISVREGFKKKKMELELLAEFRGIGVQGDFRGQPIIRLKILRNYNDT